MITNIYYNITIFYYSLYNVIYYMIEITMIADSHGNKTNGMSNVFYFIR